MKAIVGLALALAAVAGVPAGTAVAGPVTRTLTVGDLALGPDAWLAVALHPSDRPIEVVSSTAGLEACPASHDGGTADRADGTSWPSWTGFTTCLPLPAGTPVVLPSTRSTTFHLAFLVRSTERRRVLAEEVRVTYEPVDGYFVVRTPPLEPGDRSARFVVVPDAAEPVGVVASRGMDQSLAPALVVSVRQHGRGVDRERTDPTSRLRTYGPVTRADPVTVRVRNTGDARVAAYLFLDWS